MPRQISQTALQSLLEEETDQIWLACLTIDHEDMAEAIRVVHDKQDLQRNDGLYIAFPFKVTLPSDTEDEIPRVRISIGNVDRRIIKEIRQLTSAPDVTLEIVLRENPDPAEVGPFDFKLRDITYDKDVISGELGYEQDFLDEPFPGDTLNPNNARGMFK